MATGTRTPRPARGRAAVEAILDDIELSTRIDEPDGAVAHERTYRPSAVDEPFAEAVRRAAAADWLTPDEVLADLAAELGRESPYDDDLDEAYDR